MNTSPNKNDSIEKLIFDEGLRIQSLKINPKPGTMSVLLNNDHTLVIHLSFYKGLKMRRLIL